VSRLNLAKRLAISIFVVAACRPSLGGSPMPTTSSIAGDLVPSRQMTVTVHVPGVTDALASSVISAVANRVIEAAGVALQIVTPFSTEEGFSVQAQLGQTDIFLATPAAALVAREAGIDVVMIAGLQRNAGLQLTVTPGDDTLVESIASGSVLIQGRPGDQAPLLQYFDDAGVDRSALEIVFQEPSVPFDATGLFDSTYAAALVSSYDGAARLQEFLDPETGLPEGPDASSVFAGINDDALASAPGLGIWALRSSLTDEDSRIAIALAVIAIADGAAFCRDDAETCAIIMEESALLDRYGVGMIWSINQLNSTFWPALEGALKIDSVELQRAIDQAAATGVIAGAPNIEEITDLQILELVEPRLPPALDLKGEDWVPLDVPLLAE